MSPENLRSNIRLTKGKPSKKISNKLTSITLQSIENNWDKLNDSTSGNFSSKILDISSDFSFSPHNKDISSKTDSKLINFDCQTPQTFKILSKFAKNRSKFGQTTDKIANSRSPTTSKSLKKLKLCNKAIRAQYGVRSEPRDHKKVLRTPIFIKHRANKWGKTAELIKTMLRARFWQNNNIVKDLTCTHKNRKLSPNDWTFIAFDFGDDYREKSVMVDLKTRKKGRKLKM